MMTKELQQFENIHGYIDGNAWITKQTISKPAILTESLGSFLYDFFLDFGFLDLGFSINSLSSLGTVNIAHVYISLAAASMISTYW